MFLAILVLLRVLETCEYYALLDRVACSRSTHLCGRSTCRRVARAYGSHMYLT